MAIQLISLNKESNKIGLKILTEKLNPDKLVHCNRKKMRWKKWTVTSTWARW